MAAVALMVIEVETLPSGMPSKSTLHVVERVDGHADLAHLAAGAGCVGVVAHLRGQIEGDGEAGLARS